MVCLEVSVWLQTVYFSASVMDLLRQKSADISAFMFMKRLTQFKSILRLLARVIATTLHINASRFTAFEKSITPCHSLCCVHIMLWYVGRLRYKKVMSNKNMVQITVHFLKSFLWNNNYKIFTYLLDVLMSYGTLKNPHFWFISG